MPAPNITALPTAPLRSMNSSTFISTAEAWVDALTDFVTETNALADYLETLEGGTLSALLNAISAAGSSANKFAYYTGSNTVALADLTAFARTLLDDADAATALATLGISLATAAQIMAGTAGKVVTADKLHDAHAPQTLTDGATISWDMAAGFNAKVTLGGNRTLGTPTNPKVGLTYVLEVIQDGTGSRTMTWPASFNWGSAGTPTLSTTAAKVDIVTLYCRDAATPKFRAVFNKDS